MPISLQTGKWTALVKVNNWIIVHHVAVMAHPGRHYFTAVDNYHKSKGWGMIGYQWFIERAPLNSQMEPKTLNEFIDCGIIKKGRPDNMVGAHTRQQLMNYRSIGVCFAGNFDLQGLTHWQVKAARLLFTYLQLKYGIRNGKIRPHSQFATYKTCPGKEFKKIMRQIIGGRQIHKQLRYIPPEMDFIPS